MSGPEYPVGYGRPPKSTRFPTGTSGNPNGRPRGSRTELPYEAVLGQIVTMYEDGVPRQVNAAEALLLQLAKRGLEGDDPAARAAMVALEQARAARSDHAAHSLKVTISYVTPGSVAPALKRLGMVTKLDRLRPSAKLILEPWLVEAALARLGDERFSRAEQEVIVRATRTPKQVKWPSWWSVEP